MLVVMGSEINISFFEGDKIIMPTALGCWSSSWQSGDWEPMIPEQNGFTLLEM